MEDWYPGGYVSPTYPDIPYIDVIDAISGQLPRRKRRKWRESRAKALAQWEKAGLIFDVMPGPEQTWINCVPGSITIHFEDIDPFAPGRSGYGAWRSDLGCGSVLLDPERYVAGGWDWGSDLLCHEIGHVLGFSHGGTGIMIMGYGVGSRSVNAEEIAAVRDYYALA